jgi:hypothetical protein
MATSSRSGINGANGRRERRTAELYANDQQVRGAIPLEETAAIRQQGTLPMRIVATVMEGYADRPALGERVKELATDPATGLTSLRANSALYRIALSGRAGALAPATTVPRPRNLLNHHVPTRKQAISGLKSIGVSTPFAYPAPDAPRS